MDERSLMYQQQDIGLYVTKVAPIIKKSRDDSVRYFVIDPMLGEMIIALPPRVDVRLESEIRRYEQLAKAKIAASYIDSVRSSARAGSSAIANLADEFERSKQSLGQRIDPKFITEQLREELQSRNIPLDFDLKISKGETDSVLYHLAKYTNHADDGSRYSTVLFPNEVAGNEA